MVGLMVRAACCTAPPERVYRHQWSVGDTVIWDNRRTTILGDEPIE